MLKRVVVWGGIGFIVFFVAFRPGAAAGVVTELGAIFIDIMQGVGDFFRSLAS